MKNLRGIYTPEFEYEMLSNDDDDICDYVKNGEYGLAGMLCTKKEFLQDVYHYKIVASEILDEMDATIEGVE